MFDTLAAAIASASDRIADIDPTTQQALTAFGVAGVLAGAAAGATLALAWTWAVRR